MINYLADALSAGIPIYKVPLTNVPQTFEMPIAGTVYQLTCKWNDSFEAGWQIDIDDAETGDNLVAGIPLIVGADLLENLGYLGIDGQLFVYTDGNQFDPPTLDNLGIDSNLYLATSAVNG